MKKILFVASVFVLFGCGIRGYHWAGGTGDVTHAIEPGARVVVPNLQNTEKKVANDPAPAVACDESLWKHVYHQKRLVVKNACMSVTGILVDASHGKAKDGCRHEADGDCHTWLKLDKGREGLLNEKNLSDQGGNLVLEPICRYRVTQKDAMTACKGWKQDLGLPPDGSHVRVTGAYVLDTQHGHMEIHPVSSIEVLH